MSKSSWQSFFSLSVINCIKSLFFNLRNRNQTSSYFETNINKWKIVLQEKFHDSIHFSSTGFFRENFTEWVSIGNSHEIIERIFLEKRLTFWDSSTFVSICWLTSESRTAISRKKKNNSSNVISIFHAWKYVEISGKNTYLFSIKSSLTFCKHVNLLLQW